jgi:hypothetical protein
LLNSKITIKKTFEDSTSLKTLEVLGNLKNASDETKREIINELFTERQIEIIWDGLRSWASYLEYHTEAKKSEIEKYKKLTWVFLP